MAYGPAGGVAPALSSTHAHTPLNRQQIVGFWAAWFGWMLDGMDSVIYALVLGPALSGHASFPCRVRFRGLSRRDLDQAACPLMTQSGHGSFAHWVRSRNSSLTEPDLTL